MAIWTVTEYLFDMEGKYQFWLYRKIRTLVSVKGNDDNCYGVTQTASDRKYLGKDETWEYS